MKLLARLSLGALAVTLSVPSGIAKIYPDDFMVPETVPQEEEPMTPWEPTMPSADPTTSTPFFFASEIPSGPLTRAQFIDAIGTRMYPADHHDSCFGDLVLSDTVDYSLLFDDVSLDAPNASSVCVMMRGGVLRGYSDGTFRPGNRITVAEAAAMLATLGGIPLRDSNHVMPWEPWHQRFMDAMRNVDREFTMKPGDILTGAQLRHSLCVLKRYTPQVDPLDEFTGC